MFEMELDDRSMSDTVVIESPRNTQSQETSAAASLERADANAQEAFPERNRRDSNATSSISSPAIFFMKSASLDIGTSPRSRTGNDVDVGLRREATATANNIIIGKGPNTQLQEPEEQFAMTHISGSFRPGSSGGRQ